MTTDPGSLPVGGTASAVDRYLCSYTHLSPSFARYVLTELTAPSLHSVGLAYGVDLIALVRHASAAHRRTMRMRTLLATDLAVVLLAAAALLTVGDLFGAIAGSVIFASLALPYVIVLVVRVDAHRSAQRVSSSGPDLRPLARPVDAAVERRLGEVMAGNVVVFRGGWPFQGCGLPLGSWKINVDTSRPGQSQSGRPRQVIPFEATDLLRALTRAVRASGIPDLHVHNRLFVAGTGVAAVPSLLPDPMNRPAARVAPKAIRLGIAKPRPDARTYLCMEKFSWNGELVVSLYVRAELLAGDLFVEGHAFVLLPVRAEMCALDQLARHSGEILWYAVRDTARTAWRLFVRSPVDLLRLGLYHVGRSRAFAADQRRVRRSHVIDRGASTSIRGAAADKERIFMFAYADEEMILDSLRRRVLTGIEAFLDQHGVDTTQFLQEKANIINANYNIQQALANNLSIGTNATTLGSPGVPPTSTPGSPANGGAPTPPPWAGTP